ncbi:MAG TPA: hypothetical protein VJN94_17260, partial [Candidatus Binataceae bacterium]|nr:hypothetical protein [Candidatus Binataceae bacterium]
MARGQQFAVTILIWAVPTIIAIVFHEVVPDVLEWLDRHGDGDDWFCHVHLWDPHTPYNAPSSYGNPFADDPIPDWYTDDVRARHWALPGPHSAQEPWGFTPDEWGEPPARQPWN